MNSNNLHSSDPFSDPFFQTSRSRDISRASSPISSESEQEVNYSPCHQIILLGGLIGVTTLIAALFIGLSIATGSFLFMAITIPSAILGVVKITAGGILFYCAANKKHCFSNRNES